jgi:modification methylase
MQSNSQRKIPGVDVLSESAYMNKIICGDSLEVMRRLPSGCVDLALTSPPYNLKNSTGNGMKDGRGGKWSNAALLDGYSNYGDNLPNDEYAEWQRACISEMMRIISDDGALFYNHKWRVQGGLIQDRQDIVESFPVRQIIIWKRKGGINFNPGYFLPTYEVIYLIAKPKFRLAQGANSFGDIWEINQEQNNDHPAPFPEELVESVLLSSRGQTILDPFIGSGTTAAVAKRLGRNFVGIDASQDYCETAAERVAGTPKGAFKTIK